MQCSRMRGRQLTTFIAAYRRERELMEQICLLHTPQHENNVSVIGSINTPVKQGRLLVGVLVYVARKQPQKLG